MAQAIDQANLTSAISAPLWKKYTLLRKSHLSVIYFQYYIFLEKPFLSKTHILTFPIIEDLLYTNEDTQILQTNL